MALRVGTWLRKLGYANDHASNDTPERAFDAMLAEFASQRGTVLNVKDDTGEAEGATLLTRRPARSGLPCALRSPSDTRPRRPGLP